MNRDSVLLEVVDVEVNDLVRQHYGGAELEEVILRGVREAGIDTDQLTVDDLAPVDQLHAGFLPATRYLLEQLALRAETRLLDVGCGIGGPARVAAALHSCPVVGIDLSPDFVRVAQSLTERVGLSALVEHHVAAGGELDLEDASFDRAMMIHVGMNIPEKRPVFAEVRRVLRPGAMFGLFEQMRSHEGTLPYPLPWAEDVDSSFVSSPEEYVRDLEAAGFVVERTENRVGQIARASGPPPRLSPVAVFGPRFEERIANNIDATRDGLLVPVMMLARAR